MSSSNDETHGNTSFRRYFPCYKKGFTLAELLVVVAILAILVAVSIPIFTGKLEEARQNTDLANERAAKAAAIADYLQSDQESSYYKFYDAKSGAMVDATSEAISRIKDIIRRKNRVVVRTTMPLP